MPVPVEGVDCVVPQEAKKNECEKKCIAMQVLQDERECGLALVLMTSTFIDRACRWIEKKCPIVGLSVVIASRTETQRTTQNQQRGRKFPPAVTGIDQGRIKRRKIGAPLVEASFEGAKGGVEAKAAQHHDYRKDLQPPGVTPLRAEAYKRSRIRQSTS